MAQHASLPPERWAGFSLDQQVLMIGNEMNRAAKLGDARDRGRLRSAYERVFQLVDLTVQVQARRSLRRELLRWREVASGHWEAMARPGRRCRPGVRIQLAGGAARAVVLERTPRGNRV